MSGGGPKRHATRILGATAVLVLAAGACGSTDRRPAPESAPAGPSAPVATSARQGAVVFEPNVGQADPAVDFVARGRSGSLFLTRTEAVLSLDATRGDARPWVLRMALDGADSAAPAEALRRTPAVTNSYVGPRDRWRAGIPTYERAAYRDVHPGTDLVWYGTGGDLEYDLVLAPGADPDRIAWTIHGADAVAVDPAGDLLLTAGPHTLRQRAPRLHQDVDGRRRAVDGHYRLLAPHRVGFTIGAYDPTRTLVIDPVVAWSTYLGGGGHDWADALAVHDRNAYVTGTTSSADFPLRNPARFDGGAGDAFVTRFDEHGDVVYSTYLGGNFNDAGNDIAVAGGRAYVTGTTDSPDFPVTSGAFQPTYQGGSLDGFVTKLTARGAIAYSTFLGGAGPESPQAVAVHRGRAFVTGSTTSDDFPTTAGTVQPARPLPGAPTVDAFLVKLDRAGASLEYGTFLGGGDGADTAYGLAVEGGAAYVTGSTESLGFPATAGAFQTALAAPGIADAFVTKFDGSAASLDYSTYLGGVNADHGLDVAVRGGAAYVTGIARATFPTTAGAFQPANRGGIDAFAAKLEPGGGGLAYSTFVGGSGDEEGASIAVRRGRAIVAGRTTSADLPQVNGIQGRREMQDAFVTQLDAGGSAAVFSTYVGGTADDGASEVVAAAGGVWLAGTTDSTDFPTTFDRFQGDQPGFDAFLIRIMGIS